MGVSKPLLDLDSLEWEQFEQLCRHLLRAQQFENVEVISGNNRAIDILAETTRLSAVGRQRNLRWGVQVKKERVQLSHLKDLAPEAKLQGYQAVLVISPKGFVPRARKEAKLIEEEVGWGIQEFELWDKTDILVRLLEADDLLEEFFHQSVDWDAIKTQDLAQQVVDLTGCSLPEGFLIGKEIRSRRAQVNSPGSSRIAAWEFSNGVDFPRYRWISHDTIIERTTDASGFGLLVDHVRSERVHRETWFRFVFARSVEAWEHSFSVAKSEYTGFLTLGESSISSVDHLISVNIVEAGGCSNFRYEKTISDQGVTIVAIALARIANQSSYIVDYEVQYPRGGTSRQYSNTLHLLADQYTHKVRFSPPLASPPRVRYIVTRRNEAFRKSYRSGVVSVKSEAVVYAGAGLEVSW